MVTVMESSRASLSLPDELLPSETRHDDGVGVLGLMVQWSLGQQLAGGGVEVEGLCVGPAQGVGQRVVLAVLGGDGLPDLHPGGRVLGYRSFRRGAVGERRRPVQRPAPATSSAASTTAGAAPTAADGRWRDEETRHRFVGPRPFPVLVDGAKTVGVLDVLVYVLVPVGRRPLWRLWKKGSVVSRSRFALQLITRDGAAVVARRAPHQVDVPTLPRRPQVRDLSRRRIQRRRHRGVVVRRGAVELVRCRDGGEAHIRRGVALDPDDDLPAGGVADL